ncbi:uncharacterized protein TNCV_2287631 [Trichonephila clavipes]|nr:uncharacterized protein TNCV_2287631 [Trichonephila clavipes]
MKEGLIALNYECSKCNERMGLYERKSAVLDGDFEWVCSTLTSQNIYGRTPMILLTMRPSRLFVKIRCHAVASTRKRSADCAARATFGSDSIRTLDLPLPLFPSKLRRGKGQGYCKLCKNSFTVAYDGLKAVTHHAEAKKHKECESVAAMSPRMKSFFTPNGSAQSKKVDIAELTEFYHSIKHHISYVAQDCSLKVLKQVINDSDIVKQMTGGRTKCTALVNQVLFPYSMEPVQEDLKNDVPFLVATDASNKADNASVNFGVNNFVFQKLKSEENNDIIAAHCNDHIFHNCAKNALKVMPVDVENIVMKVFAEFSCSAKKREDLKECFDFFESEYREVIRHVPTRWLSLFNALDRMLSSWGPLKRYFIERGSDNCPTAL